MAPQTKEPRDSGRVKDSAKPPLGLLRAAGRSANVVAFEESIMDFFWESAVVLGVPKSLAAIYATCFASPEPLSFTDVRGRLDISAGSISQGLRVLREVGALKVVTTDRDRREFVTPDLELRKLLTHFIEARLQKQLDAGHGRLKAIAESVPAGSNGSAKVLRGRLKALQNWHYKTRAVLPLLKTFLKLT